MAHSRHVYDFCDGPLPVPAGKSTYRIKGEFYRHLDVTITTVDKKSGGALMKALARDGLDAFQRQPFVSNAFYDNLPLPRIVMCIAEITGKDVRALTEKMGRTAGERQLKGIYADLIANVTPTTFADTFTKIISFFYDYGVVAVTPGSDGKSLRMRRAPMPLSVIEWWSLVSIPFLQVPMTRNGAPGVDITWRAEAAGAHGDGNVPLGAAVWEMRWP
jgi:hypothetical protein